MLHVDDFGDMTDLMKLSGERNRTARARLIGGVTIACVLTAAAAAWPALLTAQAVRGELVEEGLGAPIEGAFIVLLDESRAGRALARRSIELVADIGIARREDVPGTGSERGEQSPRYESSCNSHDLYLPLLLKLKPSRSSMT